MRTLYVFATSTRPDVYINVLAYSVDHLQASSVCVIVISEHDYPQKEDEGRLLATTVVARLNEQLGELAEGHYIRYPGADNHREITDLDNYPNAGIYKKCLNVVNQTGTWKTIPLSDLDKSLKSFVKNSNCIFDVSALKNNLLVDVIATLLSLKFSEVYSFELKKPQSYGQSDLYHNLKENEDFAYRNLTTSKPVKQSLARISKWSLKSKYVLMATAMLLVCLVALGIFGKNSDLLYWVNIGAILASIGSYIFLFTPNE